MIGVEREEGLRFGAGGEPDGREQNESCDLRLGAMGVRTGLFPHARAFPVK